MALGGYLARAMNPLRWLRFLRWHRRQARLIRRGWYDPAARSDDEAIFIGGCSRSGTTLVREILHRHPRLACGLETAILVPAFEIERIATPYQLDPRALARTARRCRNLVEFAERFYADLLAQEGKPRWVDKATANVRVIGRLLTWLPRGRFIHVVRDGRDVVCSLRNHPREVLDRGILVPRTVSRPIRECAVTWLDETSLGLPFRDHPRCLEVRYERLVAEPEGEVGRVCEFIGEDFYPTMLEPDEAAVESAPPARFVANRNAAGAISQASVGRWRRDLSRDERVDVVNVAGELLVALGYADGHGWVEE